MATEEDRLSRNFIPLLNRLLINLLSSANEHLGSSEVDSAPRLEAFWSLGGIEPDKGKRKIRENFKAGKNIIVDEPVDRPMQYYGCPLLNMRHHNPLPQFLDRESGLSVQGEIPSWNLDPRVLGYKFDQCRATNVPGILPFCACSFEG